MRTTVSTIPVRMGFTSPSAAIDDPDHPGLLRAGPRAAGPYARSAKKAARTLEFFDKPAFSSGPESVARAVEAAATSRRPRTRYAAGRGGVLMPVTRRVLPDRVFDAVVGRLFV